MIEMGQFEPCATCSGITNMFDTDEWAFFCDHKCKDDYQTKGIFDNSYGKSYI